MTASTMRFLTWAPRILSLAFIVFLSLFALDVFGENQGFWRTAVALFIHLVPSLILLGVSALAWRWPWTGALLFALAGCLYALMAFRHPLWVATIAGPGFLVAGLYLASWLAQRRVSA